MIPGVFRKINTIKLTWEAQIREQIYMLFSACTIHTTEVKHHYICQYILEKLNTFPLYGIPTSPKHL
jgi:hypothetical protein